MMELFHTPQNLPDEVLSLTYDLPNDRIPVPDRGGVDVQSLLRGPISAAVCDFPYRAGRASCAPRPSPRLTVRRAPWVVSLSCKSLQRGRSPSVSLGWFSNCCKSERF